MREASKRRYRDDPEWRDHKRAQTKAFNSRNPEYVAKYRKAYWEKNREAIIAKGIAWNRANRDKRVAYRRKSEYGITQEQFDAMLARQGGRCMICGDELTPKNWAIDHDPKTMIVRDLLCRQHNSMIGLAHEDERILFSAIQYLQKWKLQTEA